MRAVPDLLQQVEKTIHRFGMLRNGETLGVAVSGGADSVCLLHLLLLLAPPRTVRLSVIHLNHHLRGEESNADARFVEDLAARLGLPFHLGEAALGPGKPGTGRPPCQIGFVS